MENCKGALGTRNVQLMHIVYIAYYNAFFAGNKVRKISIYTTQYTLYTYVQSYQNIYKFIIIFLFLEGAPVFVRGTMAQWPVQVWVKG